MGQGAGLLCLFVGPFTLVLPLCPTGTMERVTRQRWGQGEGEGNGKRMGGMQGKGC